MAQRQTQQEIEQLNQHFRLKTLPENGLMYAEQLLSIDGDYSDYSLAQIDALLTELHEQNIRPNDIVTQPGGLNFLMMIAGYICEVINQRTSTQTEWYNYYEAIKILPSDYNLPIDFFSSMVAMINKEVCLPLGVISELLNQGNAAERNTVSYVENRCKVISASSTPRSANEWSTVYLTALQHKDYIPGGNFYRKATDQIDFDFSLRSLADIDLLLEHIRSHEQLNEECFADFMQQPEKLNFLVALSYYLGNTLARQSSSSIKWFNFKEYVQLFSDEPNPDYRFELDHVCVCGNGLLMPMTVLMAQLFDSSDHQQSCVDYLQKHLTQNTEVLRYLPSSLRDDFHLPLPEGLKAAFSQAGYLAAYASYMTQNGSTLQPTMLTPEADGKITLHKLMHSQPMEVVQPRLDNNPENRAFQLYCEDIHAYPPTGKTDAYRLMIRVYEPHPVSLTLYIPYQPVNNTQPYKVFSAIQASDCELPETILDAAFAEFYNQAFEFIDPISKDNLWEKAFEEQILAAPDTHPANNEHLKKLAATFEKVLQYQEQTATEPSDTVPEDEVENETAPESVIINAELINSLNVQNEIYRLPAEMRAYLQVVPPAWMQNDELYSQIEAMPELYKKGRVVWAALVQANKMMFDPEGTHCPGEIVFDPTGKMEAEELVDYASRLYQLKGSTPLEADQLHYAEHISNEKTRVLNLNYPPSMSDRSLKISSIWFWRPHLPNGMLSLSYFPVIISDDAELAGEAIVLPFLFWPETLTQMWIKQGELQHGPGYDLSRTELLRRVQNYIREQGQALRPKLFQIFDDINQRASFHIDSEDELSTAIPLTLEPKPQETKPATEPQNDIPLNTHHTSVLQQAMNELDAPASNEQQKQQAMQRIVTLAMNKDTDAMQMLAYFHGKGVHVPQNSKQAFYYLVEAAKLKMDDVSFKTAMGFYASSENQLDHQDSEVEMWMHQLTSMFDFATHKKPDLRQPVMRPQVRNKRKKPLDWTQRMIRILLGIIAVLLLIALVK